MAVTVKFPELVTVHPAGVVMTIEPVVAPGITMPANVVPLLETTIAGIPPILNDDVLLKFVPVRVTRVPTGPVAGVKAVMAGTGLTIKAPETALVAVPQVPDITQ